MTEIRNIPIGKIERNKGQIDGLPGNYRKIKESRMKALVQSIEDAPEMLSLRELIVVQHGKKFVVIGGNMRLAALKEIGYKEVPCKVLPEDTPADKLREYAVKDNEGFGENDFDLLNAEWDAEELTRWGMELPDQWIESGVASSQVDEEAEPEKGETETEEEGDGEPVGIETPVLDILFPSDNDYEIPTLLKDMQGGRVELPITPWGANSRLTTGVNTYHFYVDDYRFEALFRDPSKLVNSGVKSIVEPNCSLHDQTPIAYGLSLIYKKRWLARYMQEVGVKVFADLNVSQKFIKYNRIGIPDGYNAFFTRGLADFMESLKLDLEVARQISGLDTPNLIVYGGGRKVEEFCQRNGLLYLTDFINAKKLNQPNQ